jgi:hypothetical protein
MMRGVEESTTGGVGGTRYSKHRGRSVSVHLCVAGDDPRSREGGRRRRVTDGRECRSRRRSRSVYVRDIRSIRRRLSGGSGCGCSAAVGVRSGATRATFGRGGMDSRAEHRGLHRGEMPQPKDRCGVSDPQAEVGELVEESSVSETDDSSNRHDGGSGGVFGVGRVRGRKSRGPEPPEHAEQDPSVAAGRLALAGSPGADLGRRALSGPRAGADGGRAVLPAPGRDLGDLRGRWTAQVASAVEGLAAAGRSVAGGNRADVLLRVGHAGDLLRGRQAATWLGARVFNERLPPGRVANVACKYGWIRWERQKTGMLLLLPIHPVVRAHLERIRPQRELFERGGAIFGRAGGTDPNERFRQLVAAAGLPAKIDPITSRPVRYVLKDLRKTCATAYGAERARLILGHTDGTITERHYANRLPEVLRAVKEIRVPRAFRGTS